MAYAIVNVYPGGTKEQYEATAAKVHPPGGGLPEGQTHHAAGQSDDGWVVIALWDTEQSWTRFRDKTLMPALQGGVEGGFTSPPKMISFEAARFEQS